MADGDSAPSQPLKLPRNFYESLCPYQRHGVAWLWQLFLRKQGGILADEMGLGKTVPLVSIQVCITQKMLSKYACVVVMLMIHINHTYLYYTVYELLFRHSVIHQI